MRDSLDTGLLLLCKTDTELESIYEYSRHRSNEYFEADGRLINKFTYAFMIGFGTLAIAFFTSTEFFAFLGLILIVYGSIALVLSLYYQRQDIKFAKIGDMAYDIRYRRPN